MAGPQTAPPEQDSSAAFAELLKGPAVQVTLGTAAPPESYVLPQRLLSAHSRFFKRELEKLNAPPELARASERSTLDVSSEKPHPNEPQPENPEPEKHQPETPQQERPHPEEKPACVTPPVAPVPIPTIHLPDANPPVFAHFVAFLYQLHYKPVYPRTIFYLTPQNAALHASATFDPAHAPLPIPSPFLAWLLGHALGADAFTNHSMAHVFLATGFSFSLTPAIVGWVWARTRGAGPLCNFVLDVTCQHWSAPTCHVAKPEAQGGLIKDGWDALFAGLPRLAHEFIFGLQARKVAREVRAYYVGQTAVPAQLPLTARASRQIGPRAQTLAVQQHPVQRPQARSSSEVTRTMTVAAKDVSVQPPVGKHSATKVSVKREATPDTASLPTTKKARPDEEPTTKPNTQGK